MTGVYDRVPAELPPCLCGCQAVVAGPPAQAAAAALRLSPCCAGVTLVVGQGLRDAFSPQQRRAIRACANITVRPHMDVTGAAGIARLEAVVLRHRANGRIDACNADALFLLSSEGR